ncbi:MAG TPA: hypothetical protein PKE39_11430 [Ignavibacteria bacterium]|mgnify:CR=1 FL=1|nr:hypothetical protein [Ignavibacteria bacterium]HMQ99625.1 hypothetical protein [Ignavibacteria bacterium]
MKKIIFLAALFMMLLNIPDATGQTDSLRLGRECKVVLYNGFQTEGKIINRSNDTITLKTDITKLFIPVKDVKYVMDLDVEITDLEIIDTLNYSDYVIESVKSDTTGKCDLYLQDKSVLSGVLLVADTDTTLKVIKENKSKIINLAGIRKIVFKSSAPFGKGYLIGSIIGAGVSFLTIYLFSLGGADVYHYIVYSGLGSIPFGIIGGLFGELFARDDIYLFNKGIYPGKVKRIKALIQKHT